MSQAEGLDVVWRPEVTHSDLLVSISCDDEPVVRRHGLKTTAEEIIETQLVMNSYIYKSQHGVKVH